MKTNLGLLDRFIRLVVAITIDILYFNDTLSGVLGQLLVVLSGVFVVTAVVGHCPLYKLVGFSTQKATQA